jgi:DNA-directed RNA polymerase specialized sigma24 family protein
VTERTLTPARAGDEDAFRELTDPYRHELQLHCYRIVGSTQDAEDLLQETLLSAWRGLASSRNAPQFARGCTGSQPTAAWTRCERAPDARPGW